MGLANLVPGISGGTMLLASGVYPRFIRAISEISRFKFRKMSLWVLFLVAGAAILTIGLFAGSVRNVVVAYRWATYSLFIGLTLGGIPVVWGLARPADRRVWIGALCGALPMAVLAWFQAQGPSGSDTHEGAILYFVSGLIGASAMILPGISGGYMLLLLGVYVPILDAIAVFTGALRHGDLGAAMGPATTVLLPFAVGMGVGILGVSNVLEKLFERFPKPTLGVLLGFLAGSVVGLYPFQEGRPPVVGEVFRGVVMTPERISALPTHKYPTEYFTPGGLEIAGALCLVLAGFAVTALVAKFGNNAGADKGPGRDPLRSGG